jgi:hypothetical protein
MNTETAREGLFRKLRALLAKTTEAGCTEEEALSAASLARRLMDDYNVAHADLAEPDPWADMAFDWSSPFKGRKPRKHGWHLRREIGLTIAKYCDVKARLNSSEARIKFFGHESDVMFAGWLLESLDAFGVRAWNLFEAAQALSDAPFTADRESFLLAFATRINERLLAETTTRTAPATSGSALIVQRNALLTEEYTKRFPNLGFARSQSGRMTDAASYAAGSTAANRAGFHRPMGAKTGPLLIR